MKRNALFRIILWSIVIAILTTAMVGIGFGISFNRNDRRMDRTESVLVTTPPEASIAPYAANAVVTTNALNIRKSPTAEAEVVGHFEKNAAIRVTRVESVNGVEWAYVAEPYTGWVMRKYLNMTADVPQETVAGTDIGQDTFPASAVRELEIEWAAGDIKIYPSNTDQITIREDGLTDEKYAMVVEKKGSTLEIDYCNDAFGVGFGISFGAEIKKDLTITVPRDWVCDSLEIDAASATVEVTDLTIREVDFDGASGTCDFDNCTVDELNIDTASGDVRFVGTLDILDCDAASASVYAVLKNVPHRMDMDSMSGDLELYLPDDAGFTLAMDTAAGELDTDFEIQHKDGRMVAGDGTCRISISALSGDVTIRKAN